MTATGENLQIILYALRDHRSLYSNSIDPREYDEDAEKYLAQIDKLIARAEKELRS